MPKRTAAAHEQDNDDDYDDDEEEDAHSKRRFFSASSIERDSNSLLRSLSSITSARRGLDDLVFDRED